MKGPGLHFHTSVENLNRSYKILGVVARHWWAKNNWSFNNASIFRNIGNKQHLLMFIQYILAKFLSLSPCMSACGVNRRTWGLKRQSALYRKYVLCILKNETARPHSKFLLSRICERFIYSQGQSASQIGRPILGIYSMNCSQIHEWGNWETEHYNSGLEITGPHSFISVKTYIGARHLYLILAGPSFSVWVFQHFK